MKQSNKMFNNKARGIIHILLAALFFALMTFFAKIAGDIPSIQKAFFRNVIAFIFAAVMLSKTEEKFKIKKECIPTLILRSTFGLLGVLFNFYAIDHLSISDTNMLNKLSPFFAIIFSFLILKEKANKIEWAAVVVAFIGALFVIKPEFNIACLPAVIGAMGGMCAGIAYTFVRLLGKKGERGKVIVFFFSGFSTLVLLPYVIKNFVPMNITQWIFLILTGFSAMGGQLNITAAYTYAPAKEISIYDYSQIIFAALLGFVFLGQVPDIITIIGYIIIISAAIFRWWYSNKLKKEES